MAKLTVVTTKEYVLSLNEDEAEYLIELLRNYLGPETESLADAILREALFSKLNSGIQHHG